MSDEKWLAVAEAGSTPEPNTGCWLWMGRVVGADSRAVVQVNRKNRGLARLLCGTPVGMDTRHRCDTPACVNPNHLLTGTRLDNVRDALSRGRMSYQKKTTCPRGHPRDGVKRKGQYVAHYCRQCHREVAKRSRERKGQNP
jgi:ribosomal protein S14